VRMVNSKYPGGRDASMKAAQRIEGGKVAQVRLAKGSPFADGALFAKAADLGSFALFRENADFLRALNSHAETFVFFVLGQRDDGRVTSEYAAFHKVPSRGALQSFVGDFTPGGGEVSSADIDAITAVEISSFFEGRIAGLPGGVRARSGNTERASWGSRLGPGS
jgi:hypothetical protein